MPYGVVQEMPGVSAQEYKMVEQHLGPDRPPGLLAHVAGPVEGGWRVVNVWASEELFRRFQSERLMRAAGLAAQQEGFDPAKAAGFQVSTVTGDELPY
jgi:hypothetical protein